MIERIYLDNFRSFVNFEWRPGRLALLLGPNGGGKTSLIDALASVQGFLNGDLSVHEAFPDYSRTRWNTLADQTIELDLRLSEVSYRYRLVVRHGTLGAEDTLVVAETLETDSGYLVEFKSGDLSLHREGGVEQVPGARPTRSGVGALASPVGDALFVFQEWFRSKLWMLRPDPRSMSARVDRRRTAKVPWLRPNLSNFAAWYLPTLASKPGTMFKANRAIAEAIPGFVELFDDQGTLAARFEHAQRTWSHDLDELSDGERQLIALYTLLHAVAGPEKTLVLDEPDNYLSLQEVQPWLSEVVDQSLRADGPQTLLISHHPDALNFLAVEKGWSMFRENAGPTRIKRFEVSEGVPPEMMARLRADEP